MNVLLVRTSESDQNAVLSEVVKELHEFGVRARLVWDVTPRLKHRLWTFGLPTYVIALKPIKRFMPSWAKILQQVKYDKIQEYQLLDQAGIPVPKWTAINQGDVRDLSEFGDYVVTKPAGGCRGAFVRIMRRDRVKWRYLNLEHRRGKSTAIIIQEYIHTGSRAMSYRVTTCFGEPYYAWRTTAAYSRFSFEEEFTGSHFFAGKTIVSTSKGCVMDPNVPLDVVHFGTQVHKAFPNIPLLSIDIIRDNRSGALYVLELNTAGLVMVATPQSMNRIKYDFGFDPCAQFGGARAVARGIYNRTREVADSLASNSNFKAGSNSGMEEVVLRR